MNFVFSLSLSSIGAAPLRWLFFICNSIGRLAMVTANKSVTSNLLANYTPTAKRINSRCRATSLGSYYFSPLSFPSSSSSSIADHLAIFLHTSQFLFFLWLVQKRMPFWNMICIWRLHLTTRVLLWYFFDVVVVVEFFFVCSFFHHQQRRHAFDSF